MAKNKIPPRKKEYLDEVYGIALIATGLLLSLFVFSNATGVVGEHTTKLLQALIGAGKYLIPILVAVWGIAFLIHKPTTDGRSVGTGLAISFVSLISLIHFIALDYNNIPIASAFEPELVKVYGGLIGALLAYILGILIKKGAYIVLTATFIIGIVVSTSISPTKTLSILFGKLKGLRKLPALLRKEEFEEERRPLIIEEAPMEPIEKLDRIPVPIDEEAIRKTTQLKLVEQGLIAQTAYQLPPLSLLKTTSKSSTPATKKDVKENVAILERTLRDFEVDAAVRRVIKGPTVTRYEIQLATGVKDNRILNLSDDISLALATADVRILAPIPGKSAIGIEVPNQYRELVTIGDILTSPEAQNRSILTIGIGKDIAGQPILADLGDMPHLLIAGATGSGKSIYLNSLLVSILTKAHPDEAKLILIDPKRIELTLYNHLPHLLTHVATNPKQAAVILTWLVGEMESRFEVLSEAGTRNIDTYNASLKAKGEDSLMPYIIVVIDELADLMMAAPNEVEDSICRLAQMARAVGIHLVVATQRPSVDIITGLIKANITARIAFAVSSQTDSRVILDTGGAEKLVGKGDMLFVTASLTKPKRVQGAFVTDQEVELITNFIKKQAKPHYNEEILRCGKAKYGVGAFDDELFDDAVDLVVRSGMASVSMLQRRLRVGYSRAARLIDMMEERGIVGGYEGSKPRAVLI
ncbi:MAG: DNA translocase FtsK 4TM domain-containing protein, partial [Candidatus Subteraquimicrobiales bacterium]|nr:DNA translocase FtsK 4TM domain-containing protein [Candidatus Subteraquimicrobiales bacterium]